MPLTEEAEPPLPAALELADELEQRDRRILPRQEDPAVDEGELLVRVPLRQVGVERERDHARLLPPVALVQRARRSQSSKYVCWRSPDETKKSAFANARSFDASFSLLMP